MLTQFCAGAKFELEIFVYQPNYSPWPLGNRNPIGRGPRGSDPHQKIPPTTQSEGDRWMVWNSTPFSWAVDQKSPEIVQTVCHGTGWCMCATKIFPKYW